MKVTSVHSRSEGNAARRITPSVRSAVAVLLSALCVWSPFPAFAQNSPAPLSITVVEGADLILDANRTIDVLVRVSVSGATVKFTLPAGSGASFEGGGTQQTTTSDLQGFARSPRISGTGKGGAFEIGVEATYMGQSAVIAIPESNGVPSEVGKTVSKKKGHTILWIAIIAGAAAAGVAVATMKKSDSGGSGPSSPTGTITIGNPTIGAPQ